MKVELIDALSIGCRSIRDEMEVLKAFQGYCADEVASNTLVLSQFAGQGGGRGVVNLSTIHSAKGREFEVVILIGMDNRGVFGQNGNRTRAGGSSASVLCGVYAGEERGAHDILKT